MSLREIWLHLLTIFFINVFISIYDPGTLVKGQNLRLICAPPVTLLDFHVGRNELSPAYSGPHHREVIVGGHTSNHIGICSQRCLPLSVGLCCLLHLLKRRTTICIVVGFLCTFSKTTQSLNTLNPLQSPLELF